VIWEVGVAPVGKYQVQKAKLQKLNYDFLV
jgi:hypothetical protein